MPCWRSGTQIMTWSMRVSMSIPPVMFHGCQARSSHAAPLAELLRCVALDIQETLQVLPQNRVFFLLGEALETLYPGHGRWLPADIGPVTAEDHPVGADLVN